MLRRTRALMQAALVAPEPAGFWHREMAEVCAFLVYAVAALFGWLLATERLDPGAWGPDYTSAVIVRATAVAYGTVGFLLAAVPVGLAAMGIARERDRGTMDALVLTPSDHAALAWGRFRLLLAPWLRFMFYVAPVYGFLASCGAVRAEIEVAAHEGDLLSLCGMTFLPKALVGLELWSLDGFAGSRAGLALGDQAVIPMGLRFMNDLSILLVATAAAFYISARARNTTRALVASYLLIPPALGTVLAFDAWWFIAWRDVPAPGGAGPRQAYAILAPLAMLLRFALAFWLVRKVAKNFDAYATGDKLVTPRPGRPS